MKAPILSPCVGAPGLAAFGVLGFQLLVVALRFRV